MAKPQPVSLPPVGAARGSILNTFTGAAAEEREAPAPQPPAVRAVPAPASALDTAREMVAAALGAAKDHPREQEQYTVRLPPGLRTRLEDRVAADTEAVLEIGQARGRLPALSHYVDAALAAVPRDRDRAAAWALQWIAEAGPEAYAEPVPSSSRVRTQTKRVMVVLGRRLPPGAKAWQVHAAAVSRLLDRLDEEDAAEARRNPG